MMTEKEAKKLWKSSMKRWRKVPLHRKNRLRNILIYYYVSIKIWLKHLRRTIQIREIKYMEKTNQITSMQAVMMAYMLFLEGVKK